MSAYTYSTLEGFGQSAGGVLLPRVVDYLTMPLDNYLSAMRKVGDYISTQQAWEKNPCVLPPPDVLLELSLRGMMDDAPNGGARILTSALRAHGIDAWPPAGRLKAQDQRRSLWNAVEALKQRKPDPMMYLDFHRRGLLPEGWDVHKLLTRVGCWPPDFLDLIPALASRIGIPEILGAVAERRPGWENWTQYIREAGSDPNLWIDKLPWLIRPPGLADAIEFRRRGLADVADMDRWLKWSRNTDEGMLGRYEELVKALPGISDVLRMASRQLFSPEIVGAYGLYSEFPEAMRPYFKQLGLDYSVNFNLPAQDGGRPATLPDLYWGITREILPLGAAYQAYQRLRPGAIARFQREVPGLQPFKIEDLRYHMRVAGYPPPMRDFLIALSHPPLGRRIIQQGVQFGRLDLQAAKDAYLDLGDTEDNALVEAEIQFLRKEEQENSWKRAVERRAHTTTVSEIEGMYNEGIIDRGQAMSQLARAGLSGALSAQLLDLSDARRARGLLRAAVSATGRDYLSGVLSAGEATAALTALGIKPARAGELMQIWTVRRSRHRRQASTAQIIRWVGLGRLPFAEGSRRLGNLGWSDPDQILLLADAQATRDKANAREVNLAGQADAKRAKEIERLAREAQAEHRRLIGEANRVAPRSVLLQWLRAGEMTQDDFRAALRARDFPEVDIDRYVEDALRPSPGKTRKVPESGIYPRAPGSRHPALTLVEKMYLTEVISADQFRQYLSEMGYAGDDLERVFAVADLKHGKAGTTREPPASAPPP